MFLPPPEPLFGEGEKPMSSPRRQKREQLHGELRRTSLIQAGLVGILAGAVGVAYQLAVGAVNRLSHGLAVLAVSRGVVACAILVLAAGCLGALSAYLISRHCPESGGSGIPHVKASLLHLRVIRPVRLLIAKFLGGLAALATGMSLGREGPTIQMGAAVGKLVGNRLRSPKRARNALVAAGAGAGLASAFNAPLAGFLFVMEELKREMSALTYGSALLASVAAVAVTRYTVGESPSFVLPSPGPAPLAALPLTALLGVLAGLAGILFNRVLVGGLEIRRRLAVPAYAMGAIAGIAAAAALILAPQVSGGGHKIAESLLSGHFPQTTVWMILALFAAKLILTVMSYVTGLPGGIFAPILVMGALVGYSFGLVVHQLWPAAPFSSAGFATIGMAAMLSASVRAPLTGVVLIVEMTAEYGLLYALLVSAFVAALVAQALKDEPIYEALMERDLRLSGAEVHPEEEPILLDVLVEPHSHMDGRRIRHLKLPAGSVVATMERGSRHIVPGGNTLVEAGDLLTILVEGHRPELSLLIHEAARAPG